MLRCEAASGAGAAPLHESRDGAWSVIPKRQLRATLPAAEGGQQEE